MLLQKFGQTLHQSDEIFGGQVGYGVDSILKKMEPRDELTQVSMRNSRKPPVDDDHSLYLLRNLVERRFNNFKSARRIATRYEKTAESFLDFIDTTPIRLWLRLFSI